jgi:hypothetical protein
MIGDRTIITSFGAAEAVSKINRGIPQGGILSPLLWLLLINELIGRLLSLGFETVCYADDIVIWVSAKNKAYLEERAQLMLDTAVQWAYDSGLTINAEKTEICLIHRKRNINNIETPRIGNKRIEYVQWVKYLGIFLDQNLRWK